MIWFLVCIVLNCIFPSADANAANRDVRLTGGNGDYEGRVEINIMTPGWGNVCDNTWDVNDATVRIVLQLHYSLGAEHEELVSDDGL